MQLQCDAAESRMQAARKAFDKTRKPLEAVVRLQREELARRKVRQGQRQGQRQRQWQRQGSMDVFCLPRCCLCENSL